MRISQSVIAEALGVSQARISQMKSEGMPVDSIEAAAAWYVENVDKSFDPRRYTAGAVSADAEEFDIQRARARREHFDAQSAELKAKQAAAELVEVARVNQAVVTLAAMTRSALERIPDRLADSLAAESNPTACSALLTVAIDAVLSDLARDALALKFEAAR